MSSPRPSALGRHGSHLGTLASTLAGVVALGAPAPVLAQTAPTLGGIRRSSEVSVHVEPDEPATPGEPGRLWSHEGERIAGGLVLGLGLPGAIGLGVAIGSAHCGSLSCEGGGLLALGLGLGLGVGVLVLGIGLPLVAWGDGPAISTPERARMAARIARSSVRLAAGPGDLGLALVWRM